MNELSLRLPNNVAFGTDILAVLPGIVKEFGTRVLLISESVPHDARYIDKVSGILRSAGLDVIIYDELSPTSGTSVVQELAALAKASQTRVVLGLGGMRVLATARCVANVASGEVTMEQLKSGTLPQKPLAYIEVPSSYRNHSMMRTECIMRDSFSGGPIAIPIHPATTKAVVVDTAFSQTLSSKYAIAAIVDTLLAAIEGYTSRYSTFYSDVLLERALGLLQDAVRAGTRNPTDMRYRHKAAQAGLLTAFALANVSQGAGGALAYTMNARFHLPKSWVAAILLPHVVDALIPANAEKMVGVARALGEPVEGIIAQEEAHRAAKAIRKIVSQLDLPSRLRDLDVSIDELIDASDLVTGLFPAASSSQRISPIELQQLIKAAY